MVKVVARYPLTFIGQEGLNAANGGKAVKDFGGVTDAKVEARWRFCSVMAEQRTLALL